MPEALLAFDGWLLRTTLGGGVVLLIGTLWMAFTRQPVQRQRIGELALLAALLVALPAALPTWWSLSGNGETSATTKALFGQPFASNRLKTPSNEQDQYLSLNETTETEDDLDAIENIERYLAHIEEKDIYDSAMNIGTVDNAPEHNCSKGETSSFITIWGRWGL